MLITHKIPVQLKQGIGDQRAQSVNWLSADPEGSSENLIAVLHL